MTTADWDSALLAVTSNPTETHHTGGGCMALRSTMVRGGLELEVLITEADGADLPTGATAMVGVYDQTEDGYLGGHWATADDVTPAALRMVLQGLTARVAEDRVVEHHVSAEAWGDWEMIG